MLNNTKRLVTAAVVAAGITGLGLMAPTAAAAVTTAGDMMLFNRSAQLDTSHIDDLRPHTAPALTDEVAVHADQVTASCWFDLEDAGYTGRLGNGSDRTLYVPAVPLADICGDDEAQADWDSNF